MTCTSCEKRREWIKQQLERAKQSWQLLMQRDNNQVARSNDSTVPFDGNTESTTDFNCGSEQPIDESSTKPS